MQRLQTVVRELGRKHTLLGYVVKEISKAIKVKK